MNTDRNQSQLKNTYRSVIFIILRAVLFALFFSFLFAVCFFLYIAYKTQYQYKDRIYPGVYIHDINVSGFTKQKLYQEITRLNTHLSQNFSATIRYSDAEIATFSASMLHVQYEQKDIFRQAYNSGRRLQNKEDLTRIIQQIMLGRTTTLVVFPTYNLLPITKYLDKLDKTYSIPPKNALFTVDGNRVIAFEQDKKGIGIDKKHVTNTLLNHFKQSPRLIEKPLFIIVPIVAIDPEFTMEDANDFGIVEPIGIGVSNFAHSAAPRIFNIKLVSSRVNGTLVPVGEIFSFNNTVGEISFKTGYQAGYAIISGKTVLSDGGGVCQESTTIFRAALNAGLPIEQWKNHSYRVRYYEQDSEPGFDATVYAPSVDFKFKNDTSAHILVQSTISDGTILTVTLYGKKDGRIASISASRVWGVVPPPEPLYTDDPTLPKGTTKQIDYAAWGAKASFDYRVTRGTEELQNRTFLSVYRPWQASFLVGTQ